MATPLPRAAASSATKRGFHQPVVGRGATAGKPFGEPVDYPERVRFVRPAPPEVLARAMGDDEALNAIRARLNKPSRLDRIAWTILIGLGVVSSALVVTQ